jgi:hypothetical protein
MFKLPKVVEVSLHDLIDNDLDHILDLLSEKATGSPLLQDITYRVVGCVPPHTLYIEVDGDDSAIDEEPDAEGKWPCPVCHEHGTPQETLGNGKNRYFLVSCENADCDYEESWNVPFSEADYAERGMDSKDWPPCGVAGCEIHCDYVDSAGVGFCSVHENDGIGNTCLAVRITDFDPWWIKSVTDQRFAGLRYGEWPEDVPPGENARPGWGLPAGPVLTNNPQEPQ